MKPIKLLVKTCNESKDVKDLMTKVCYEYSEKIDKIINKKNKKIADNIFNTEESSVNPNRPLFAEATTKKIIGQLNNMQSSESNE